MATRVKFFTNLDGPLGDVHAANEHMYRNPPGRVPCVGERVRFYFSNETRWFDLEVVTVTWEPDRNDALVELHIPSSQRSMSIAEWSRWFEQWRRE